MPYKAITQHESPPSAFEMIVQDRSIRFALLAFAIVAFGVFGPFSQGLVDMLYHPALADWMPSAICFHKPPLV